MNFRRSILTSLLAFVGVAGSLQAGVASTNVPPAQIKAYLAMTKADRARDREEWAVAIPAYREAISNYTDLAKGSPNYNPDIVQYRLAYCANQITAITRKTGKSEQALMGITNALSITADVWVTERTALLHEINRLSNVVLSCAAEKAALTTELEKQATALKTAEETLARQADDTQLLVAQQAEIQRLEKELSDLRNSMTEHLKDMGRIREFKRTIAELEKKIERLEKERAKKP